MGVQISGDTGNVLATKGTYTGNLTVGGVLTYEDVTNVDSVGLITARSGIEIGARPGVAASISVDGNMIVSGISTFGGDVSIADKIIHTGDTDTAIRFSGADTIKLETGGSERLKVDSNGDTIASGTLYADSHLFMIDKLMHTGDTDTAIRFPAADTITAETGGSERLRIDSSGNVGMGGNTNPTNVLHIKTAATNTAVATIESTATNSYPFLRLKNDAREYQLTCHGGLSDAFTIYDGTSNAHRFLIDSSGRILQGSSTGRNTALMAAQPTYQLEGTSSNTSNFGIFCNSNAGAAGGLIFGKTRGSAVGGTTVVQENDSLGHISFEGSDGSAQRVGARITAAVDGTPGSSDMPGRLMFFTTPDGSATEAERLRITSDGKFGFGTNSPDQTVHIQKGDASASSTSNTVLTLENSTTNVLQFLNPNNTAAQVRFGDPQDNGAGFIEYSHDSNMMSFGANGPTKLQLNHNGNLFLRGSSANYLVMGSSGDATSGGVTNNMNWIRGNGTNTQLNCAGGFISFEISGSEIGRFSNDDFLVGTTSNSSSNGVGLKLNYGSTNPTFNCVIDQSAGNHSFYHLYNTNATHNAYRFYVMTNGGIANHSGNNSNLSDERMKKNITDMGSVYDTFKGFKFKDFNYLDDEASESKKHGLIAQDVETIDSDLITEDFKIAPDSEGNDVYRKALKEEQFMMIGMKALQEAIAKIDTLEAEVAALKGS